MSSKKADKKLSSMNFYERLFFFVRLGNEAVHKVQKENSKKGIPNTYNLNGKLVYELPNGTITTKSPWK